jgi:hypothetical protein
MGPMQAARALNHLNGSLLELHRESFRLLPSYLTELITRDPTGHFHLEKGPEGVFRGGFVCPGVSQEAYTHHLFMLLLRVSFGGKSMG